MRKSAARLLMGSIMSFFVSALSLHAAPLTRHDGHSGDELIEILEPQDGSILLDRSFSLFIRFHEVPGLDHIHYGISRDKTEAEKGLLTFPDLSGATPYALEPEQRDGTYWICAYLAAEDHEHLSATECSTFELQVSGLTILEPSEGRTYRTYTTPFEVEAQGFQFPHSLWVQVGESEAVPLEGIGSQVTLENGTHTLSVYALDEEGNSVGRADQITLTIASPLTLRNLRRARAFLRTMHRTGETTLKSRALRLLKRMSKGDETIPGNTRVGSSKVKEILKIVRRARSDNTLKKARRKMRQLLRMPTDR